MKTDKKLNTYVILRRNAWSSPADLEAAAARSSRVGTEETAEDTKWIRSYVLQEEGERLGTVCIYQATSEEWIYEHARRAGLPADEVIPVANTVIVNEDPVELAVV